jgi:hypothetical protein
MRAVPTVAHDTHVVTNYPHYDVNTAVTAVAAATPAAFDASTPTVTITITMTGHQSVICNHHHPVDPQSQDICS